MKLPSIIVLTGLLSLMSTSAMAAEAPDFAAMDANEDSSIDAAEFDKAKNDGVKKTFNEADADKDGKISKEEYGVIKEPDCD
ncbi:MAG: hypothetical protein V3U87_17185 [Methylococcaceae bacterium]